MSVRRKDAKRDANEREIVEALRSAGAVVMRLSGRGLPDLLVGFRGQTFLFDVKDPRTGRITDDQRLFFDAWRDAGGPAGIVHTPREALEAIGAVTS